MSGRRRIPIACTLTVEQRGGRLGEWRALMAHALGAPEATAEGARVRFPRHAAVEAEVDRLVAAESACCAFFEFAVEVEDAAVVLSVGAPPEARALVEALVSPPG